MASDPTKELNLQSTSAKVSDSAEFGSYGKSATKSLAQEAMESLKTPSLADSKLWLNEYGITTTDPVYFKRIWSPQFEHHWQTKKWSESYSGRLAMRSVSRGVIGAAFYGAAQIFGTTALKNYDPKNPHGVLQYVIKGIDSTAGEAIKFFVRAFNHGDKDKAIRAVTFRDTKSYGYNKNAAGETIKGRSLGHEAVSVTFDFAAMSFSDYMSRYFIGLFDKNAGKTWMKNGHIDVPGGLKDLFVNIFKGITYAAGEDMAVAIPYSYYMKWQRGAINKISPGFKFDFDNNVMGSSLKVDKQGKVIGDYQLEGMLDLMGRFSVYNVGTKMFRDAYSNIEMRLQNWWHGDRKVKLIPRIDPELTMGGAAKSIGSKIINSINYVVRTTIKVMFYMIPSSFIFALIRSPQGKSRSHAINPETESILVGQADNGKFYPVKLSNNPEKAYFTKDTDVINQSSANEVPNPFYNKERIDSYNDKTFYPNGGTPWYTRIANKVGLVSFKAGTGLSKITGADGVTLGKVLNVDPKKAAKFPYVYANASLAYTPYFMAKTDVGSAFLDTSRSDIAIDRWLGGSVKMVGSLFTLNGSKIKAAWKELYQGTDEVERALLKQPFRDEKREKLAEESMKVDREKFSNEAYQQGGYTGYEWSEAETRNRRKMFANEALKSNRPTLAVLGKHTVKTENRPSIAPSHSVGLQPRNTSYVTQEALDKFHAAESSESLRH